MPVNRLAAPVLLAVAIIVGTGLGYRAYVRSHRAAAARQLLRVSEQGLSRLREAFNRDACNAIYDDASGGFRDAIPRAEWAKQCGTLRTQLGRWQDYEVALHEIPVKHAAGYTQLEGRARFAQGEYLLTSWWSLGGERAELLSLCLDQHGEKLWISAVKNFAPGPRLQDPPRPRRQHPS